MSTLLTVNEVAKLLKVHVEQVRLLIRSGRLVASNIGLSERKKQYRVSEEALAAFLQKTEVLHEQPARPVARRRRRRLLLKR